MSWMPAQPEALPEFNDARREIIAPRYDQPKPMFKKQNFRDETRWLDC
jgi:hypothetical protein